MWDLAEISQNPENTWGGKQMQIYKQIQSDKEHCKSKHTNWSKTSIEVSCLL